MKNSIGIWIDTQLQKNIKCFQDEEYQNLQEIYENIFINPGMALNAIRGNLEKLLKNFLHQNHITTKDSKGKDKVLYRLIDSYKEVQQDELYEALSAYLDEDNRKKLKNNKIATYPEIKLSFSYISLTLTYYAEIIRVYGNNGSHSNDFDKEELSKMAIISFLGFFDCYKILKNKDSFTKCKNFSDFIYNDLQVIYETKDDVEEWEKIRFNKLKFNYDLYQIDILNKKPVLNKIIQKEKEKKSSKNIYFLNLKNYKKFKKMYQDLENIEEEDYFDIKEKIIDIDTIDVIPLHLSPKNENHPHKWDMCYINLSIEFDDFGVDLILFLNFNQEKFNLIKEEYNLEIQDF